MLILSRSETKWNFKKCPLTSLFNDTVTTEAFHLDYPIEDASEKIWFAGSCNGLVLLTYYSKSSSSLLWNPTTRMHKILPDFRPTWKKNCAIYGFGYDELHDDCKVLGIFYNYGGSDGVEVEIYSLKSDSWTSVDYCGEILSTSGSYRKMELNDSGLFVNGKLHWDTTTGEASLRNLCLGRNIITFDLANEKWETMEKPSYGVGETDLGVERSGSDLCVFSDYKGTHLGAWVMKEYGVKESWIKMFTIKYPDDQNFYPPFFMSNESEILAMFRSKFMIYNSKDDSFRYPDIINFGGCHDAEIYIESLVCPFSSEVTEHYKKKPEKAQIKTIE